MACFINAPLCYVSCFVVLCCSVCLVAVGFVLLEFHHACAVLFLTACVINSGTLNKDLNFTQSPLFVGDFTFYLADIVYISCSASFRLPQPPVRPFPGNRRRLSPCKAFRRYCSVVIGMYNIIAHLKHQNPYKSPLYRFV